jgi:hypothetical protein
VRRLLTAIIVTTLAAGTAFAAGKGTRHDYPTRYVPRSLDGEIVQVRNDIDGHAWSAWAYRNGAEYDLALSVSLIPGVWGEPRLLGLDDGLNQGQPAFSIDSSGNVYLAYSGGDGSVHVRALRAGSLTWSPAATLADERGRLSSPSLKVVGNSLVIGYRLGERVELATLPLLPSPAEVNTVASIYDGPDPTGNRDEDDNDDESQSEFTFETNDGSNGVDLRPNEGLGEEN